jgi:hypothetical protein
MLPPEEVAPAQRVQARVQAPAPAEKSDQEELAAALEELDAERGAGEKRKADR